MNDLESSRGLSMVTAEVGVDLVTKLKDKGFKDLEVLRGR